MKAPVVLALDFGGTKHTAAIAEMGSKELLAREQTPSPTGADRARDLEVCFGLARRLLRGQGRQPAAVGISFGGPVDFPSQRVRLSHHVPGWQDTPLGQLTQEAFGAPAVVDNDANCGALGEWRWGAGQGCASLLYMTVSTGIGGGWIVNGDVFRGADSLAGEIGHTPVDPAGPECVCGRRGCLEALACGPAIARRAREALAAQPGDGARLLEMCGGTLKAVTAETVSRAAAEGDRLSEAVLLAAARDLGTGIGNAITLMNPERVVLGGGVTKAAGRFWAEVRRAARANTLPEISVEIVPAGLGEDAPLRGAVALAEMQYNPGV